MHRTAASEAFSSWAVPQPWQIVVSGQISSEVNAMEVNGAFAQGSVSEDALTFPVNLGGCQGPNPPNPGTCTQEPHFLPGMCGKG